MNLDYNKLSTFIRVAETRSVTRAAIILGRTQSAITQQLKNIENELGIELFVRKPGTFNLTREGHGLFEKVSPAFKSIEDNVNEVIGELSNVRGTIKIGVSTEQLGPVIIPAMRKMYECFPRVSIQILHAPDEILEQALANKELDLALITAFKDKTRFDRESLFTFFEQPFASREYLESFPKIITIDDLFQMQLIDFEMRFSCFGTWIRKNAPEHISKLKSLNPAIVVRSHSSVRDLIVQGMGVGLSPTYLLEDHVRRGEVISLFPEASPLRVTTDLSYLKKKNFSLLEEKFCRFLKEAVIL